MKAAEKIPKKLYVYLDTTRGLHHRHGVKDVRRRGAGHRVRHARKRRVRRYPDADVNLLKSQALIKKSYRQKKSIAKQRRQSGSLGRLK